MALQARTDRRRSAALVVLLLLYMVGRALQLFAGRVPNIVIVVFHVVPPAVFVLIHGNRIYGRRAIFVFTALCLGVATVFELLSLRTGFPFGHYEFTNLMGPKLFGLPLLLALAYLGMAYLSWVIALLILDCQHRHLSVREVLLLPLVASFAMGAWDLSMDPVWAYIDHGWIWRDGGLYYGVPISNFFGWFLTVYTFYQLFALYIRNRPASSHMTDLRLPILFYAASALGNLLVTVPSFFPKTFVDGSGRVWFFSEILWACRFVSIFLMLPLCILAWVRTSRSAVRGKNEPMLSEEPSLST